MSYEEIILIRIMNTSSLQPHYWSELLSLANQLLDDQGRQKLQEMIAEVEQMVLETKRVREELPDGSVKWKTVVKGEASLYDIEMAIESNMDYYAYFEKEDGTIVTKFDIERRLDKIRKWIFDSVRERAANRRFSRM